MIRINNNYQISIDTLHLIAKLTKEEIQFIHDRFNFTKSNKFYNQTLHFGSLGVRINLSPKKAERYGYFNATIHLHKDFFTADIPDTIREIIREIDWSVRRLDIAYDFKTDKQNSILFKHHKRLKDSSYSNETYYIGFDKDEPDEKKKKSIIHYDRNVKLKKRNLPIIHEYGNRMEPRLIFPMKDMKLHQMNHELIMKELKRYRFISNIDTINADKWQRNRLYKIQQDYQKFLSYPDKIKRKIRNLLRDNREPLEQYYDANRAKLFNFLSVINETSPKMILEHSADYFFIRHSTAGKRYLYLNSGGGGSYAEVS